ncbi:UNVERIFIED_CONTAM: hypothetical protein PYX00_007309 [Menopon gallinae]|uniref:DNA helicase MCM8 n=1 Tax=Menopon gallinae TaxID=328185 RepID=A0AAW2HIA8_9NEOP
MEKKDNQGKKYFNKGRGWYQYKNRNFGQRFGGRNDRPAGLLIDQESVEDCASDSEDYTETSSSGPYTGWNSYFSDEVYSASSNTVQKVQAAEEYITRNQSLFNLGTIEEARSFSLDLKLLNEDEIFKNNWSDFDVDLYNQPVHTLNCIGLAMHKIVSSHILQEIKDDDEDVEVKDILNVPVIRARIINYDPISQLRDLKANYFGKLVSIKGTVIRVGNIKLVCTSMAFQCRLCSAVQTMKQSDGVYSVPKKCKRKGCRSLTFLPQVSSHLTKTINWQCVRLQEIIADEHRDGGRVPRTIECELTADLVDSCSPGDIVVLNGILKTQSGEENSRNKNSNVFQLYVDVVSVINNKNLSGSGKSTVEFNIKDYYAIKEIHSDNQLFRLIVQSLCPSIYGHELVKAGLILCMFGGSQKTHDSRAEPHILVVGDPGLGKSCLLQACANVAPRGVYVCGNTSTSSGLTVTLNRESGGDYALEAGALVLSDQGCCCIDEFDKMSSQHQALLEAMEQQTISIAKAGVVCSLPARTSILAAANPIGGHYNKAKTVSENLKMGPALLSRFDLVFILLDQPNEELDSMLSEHVMALHSGLKKQNLERSFISSCGSGISGSESSLRQRLKIQRSEELDLIPHALLRKYVAYARKYVKPKLTPEAARVLQQFYLDLRKYHQKADCTPVTTRQLESLIRLTEARAKVELRVEATEDDAKDVVEILKYSMWDTFTDQFGKLDFRRSQNGSGMSSASKAKKFIRILQNQAELQSRSVFSVKELKDLAKTSSIQIPDFYSFLSTLNLQGFLLKKGDQMYQVLSADY